MKRRIFKILFISVFATMLGFGIVEPLLPIYAESMGASGLWIGAIFSAFMFSRAIFSLIIGKMSDRSGRRKFILAGLFTYALLSIAYILARNSIELTLARFLQGLTSALVVPVAMAYIGDIAPRGEEGRYFGLFTLALFLGMAAGPLMGGTVAYYFSIEHAFILMGVISLFAFVLAFNVLPEIRNPRARKQQTAYKDILKDRTVKALLIFRAANAVGVSGLMAFFPLFAASLGIDTMRIGILVSANLLTLAILQPYFGRTADKHDKSFMVTAGTVIFSISLILMGFATSFAWLFLINIMMGIGGAISIPAATVMMAKAGKKMGMGSVLAVFSTAMSIGHTIGPLFAGLLYGMFFVGRIFLLLGVLNLLASAIFYVKIKKLELR